MISRQAYGIRIGVTAFACAAFLAANQVAIADQTIDAILSAAHQSEGIATTPICDDATYLRRLSLDLIGRVPSEKELNQFLADPDRTAAVDRLLANQEHAEFWSQLWTTTLIGRGEQRYVEREILRAWTQEQLSDNTPLDQFAFRLITAEGVTSLNGPVNYTAASREDPVMRLSRTFLSVQLDCAQCHDHPHDRWTNDDYVAMKRFFDPTRFREVSGGIAVSDGGADRGDDRPKFLTGRQPRTSAWRRELGMMVVTSKPFSRAMVNRTWHWLMGRGIVDPVDGLSRDNPAVIPELLESLSTDLRERFDLRNLIREICLSKAYQRQPSLSDSTDSENQRRWFAARSPRMLLPEQWIRSVSIVLDRPVLSPQALAERSGRMLGLVRQATPATDPFQWNSTTQTTIRQLSASVPPPVRDLDSIFLVTLARKPSERERRLVSTAKSQEIVFALVHGNEFLTND